MTLWGITYHDDALRILDMPFLETTAHRCCLRPGLLRLLPMEKTLVYAVAEKSWITDGLDESVQTAILDQIGWIADDDEAVALQILDIPFLETVEETDVVALEALRLLGADLKKLLLIGHGTVGWPR